MADTMIMGDAVCNVVYVDAGIGGGAGDGSTPAVAVANIPAVGSLVSNTVYLIRRTLAAGITLTNGTLTTGANIFLIGMPMPTDWLYERVPETAKAAWDADVALYALANFAGYQISFSLNPIDRCGFHRLQFTRPSPNSGYGYCAANSTMQLDIRAAYTGSEYTANGDFFFTNNWWCDYGIPLSSPNWVTNTPYHSGGMQFAYARNVKFCNNHIEFNGSYNGIPSWNPSSAICLWYVRRLVMNDNDMWMSSFGSNGNNFYYMYVSQYNGNMYTEFCRNTMKLVCQNYTYVCVYSLWQVYGKDVLCRDNSITVDRYYNRPGITSGSYYTNPFSIYNANQGYGRGKWDVQNILVDMGDIAYSVGQLISFSWRGDYRAYGEPLPGSIIKNITARCAPNSGLANSTNVGIANSYGGRAFYGLFAGASLTISDIKAWHYYSDGLYLIATDGSFDWTQWKGPVMKNVSVKGRIAYVYCMGFVHITDWAYGGVPADAILKMSNSTVYIERMTIDPTGTWLTADSPPKSWFSCQDTRFPYGDCIVDRSDVPFCYIQGITSTTYGPPSTWDNLVAVNNIQNVPGKWYGATYYYAGQTCSAYRTGGAGAAIRLTCPPFSDYHNNRLQLMSPPFRGFEWTPVQAGAAKATVYFAHKLMSVPSLMLRRIKVLVTVPFWDPVTSEYIPRTVMGDVAGKLLDDPDSVWNNDTGLVQKRLEIPFKVTEPGQVVTVRIYYDWYDPSPNGYCYLDPTIQFAMA